MGKKNKYIGSKMVESDSQVSRRYFMKSAGFLSLAVAGTLVAGCKNSNNTTSAVPPQEQSANTKNTHAHMANSNSGDVVVRNRGLMFFSNLSEAKAIAYAAERIFPADENGPGALELGVVYFIDNQCAGSWGNHSREYMSGPFKEGVAGQGYQAPILRKDLMKQGAKALMDEANKRYNDSFYNISADKQDTILKDMEAGKIIFTSEVSSKYFFDTLKSITIAGVFSDPIYNGNKDMGGWKMKRYPGAQMAYIDTIMEEKFQQIAPMSLSEMQGLE